MTYTFPRLGVVFEIPDLAAIVYDALMRIPRGRVTTYGELAKALGDVRAARAVAEILRRNERPDVIPCYKVVMSDGTIGGYSLGIFEKLSRLEAEGIEVKDGKIVNFERIVVRAEELGIPDVLRSLSRLQVTLASEASRRCAVDSVRIVAGADLAYVQLRDNFDLAVCALVVYDLEAREVLSAVVSAIPVRFAYVPTYLAFREAPAILLALENLERKPDVIFLDGHGLAHPRRFGIAVHVGVLTRIPSVGIAKSILCGRLREPRKVGDKLVYPLELEGEIVGYCVERSGKRIYVSPGFGLGPDEALDLVLRLDWRSGREPSLMLCAHRLCTRAARHLRTLLTRVRAK